MGLSRLEQLVRAAPRIEEGPTQARRRSFCKVTHPQITFESLADYIRAILSLLILAKLCMVQLVQQMNQQLPCPTARLLQIKRKRRDA